MDYEFLSTHFDIRKFLYEALAYENNIEPKKYIIFSPNSITICKAFMQEFCRTGLIDKTTLLALRLAQNHPC